MPTNEEKAIALAYRLKTEVRNAAGKGLNKARLFAEKVVKIEASVKAPTRRTASGRVYATTRATPGAPLRVVSGRFFKSITSEMTDPFTAVVGSNARAEQRTRSIIVSFAGVKQQGGFNYPAAHEIDGYGGYSWSGGHKTFAPAIEKHIGDLRTIVGSEVKSELSM